MAAIGGQDQIWGTSVGVVIIVAGLFGSLNVLLTAPINAEEGDATDEEEPHAHGYTDDRTDGKCGASGAFRPGYDVLGGLGNVDWAGVEDAAGEAEQISWIRLLFTSRLQSDHD